MKNRLLVIAAFAVVAPVFVATPASAGGVRPDLAVAKLPVLPASAAPGQKLALKVTVANKGRKKSGKSKVSFRLSSDRTPSGKDLATGKGTVGALKPKQKKSVTVNLTIPAGAKGSLYLIACVSKVKGESGGANNCLAPTRATAVAPRGVPAPQTSTPTPAQPQAAVTPPPTPDPPPPPPDPDPTFPERFVGTATATHTVVASTTGTGTGNSSGDLLPGSRNETYTFTADVVFTRQAVQGGYKYRSTGNNLLWRVQRTSHGGHRNQPGQDNTVTDCSADSSGTTSIGPFETSRFASASLVRPEGSSMGPGGLYNLTSAWDFAGFPNRNTVLVTSNCTVTGPDAQPYSSNDRYEPTYWLPSDTYLCDPTPGAPARKFSVGLDGKAKGQDSCVKDETRTLQSGSVETLHYTSNWSWDLAPAGP